MDPTTRKDLTLISDERVGPTLVKCATRNDDPTVHLKRIDGGRPKPTVDLTGCEDDDVVELIVRVMEALRKDGRRHHARVFRQRACESPSYDAVLALAFDFVDVKV
jgi:hypothetical protein